MSFPTKKNLEEIAQKAGRVGVLMGGTSSERDISLQSGRQITKGLRSAGIDALPIDWQGDVDTLQIKKNFDRYFIALHGRGGEDGKIQAVLDLYGIPYTGSGALACSLAMDKPRSKLLWQGANLSTPPFEIVNRSTDFSDLVRGLGLPLFVKPAREGSSLGITKVCSLEECEHAVETALTYDEIVLAEKFVMGAEYTASILEGSVLPLIRLEAEGEFYDYHAKYVSDDTRYVCPCGLSEEKETELMEFALRAFNVIGGTSWGRVDFICDQSGLPWLIEANMVPGMTSHSLVPMAAKEAGLGFSDLVVAILGSTIYERISL